ncbi:MAG: tetratricopeptide repeat protein [Isosphaeraceae bacterium]|nr:tetratricopeptide repeat protein [Isosphaeraceae bacterium]
MSEIASDSPALSLVHEGWNHLRRGRPLAARASWLRAARSETSRVAAEEAIAALDGSPDLPGLARIEIRLRAPASGSIRLAWDRSFHGEAADRLGAVAEAFGRVVEATPDDADAWFNLALGLAWQGRNLEAVDALEESVRLDAASRHDLACSAWSLAELLRQGGGAESIADDLSYSARLTGAATAAPELVRWLESRPSLVPARLPAVADRPPVLAWLGEEIGLDRPPTRRILAYVFRSPGSLELSSPDATALEPLREQIESIAGESMRREAKPLPLSMLDAAVFAIDIPNDADPEERPRRLRSAVESWYENHWINRPRQGLGGRTPLEASRLVATDPVLAVELSAVVAFREQLGDRPSVVDLYRGYPFDRLRRRLGLPTVAPSETLDPDDPTCMSEAELDRLDPSTLEPLRLAEAFGSALAFGIDDRAGRFARRLLEGDRSALRWVDRRSLFALLVRESMREGDPEEALSLLEQAVAIDQGYGGADSVVFSTWRAEVLARDDRPGESLATYRRLLESNPDDAERALDAAESLLDQGHHDEARELAEEAQARAERVGDRRVATLAARMLGLDRPSEEI